MRDRQRLRAMLAADAAAERAAQANAIAFLLGEMRPSPATSAEPDEAHEADEAEADALARADNVGVAPVAGRADADLVAAVRDAVAHHLATVQAGADMIGTEEGALRAASTDLVKAHAWRAARLSDILNLLGDAPVRRRRRRSLSSIVVQVVDGFAAECRMTGVTLDGQMTEAISHAQVNDDELFIGLTGAVCALLPLLENVARPALVVKLAVSASGAVSLDTVLDQGVIPPTIAARFFDPAAVNRPGGACATAGALAAKMVAERQGGTATLGVDAKGGGVLQLRMPHRA